jgi:hypothetical protein
MVRKLPEDSDRFLQDAAAQRRLQRLLFLVKNERERNEIARDRHYRIMRRAKQILREGRDEHAKRRIMAKARRILGWE